MGDSKAEVLGALGVGFDMVELGEAVDEVLEVGGFGLFNSKVVDHETKRDVTCLVSEQHGGRGLVVTRLVQ